MTLKFDTSRLDRKLAAISTELLKEGKRAIKETSEQAVKIIVQRTRQKSQDKDGKKFKKYSDAYLKQRQDAGATSRVILTSSGSTAGGKTRKKQRKSLRGNAQGGTMLNSLTIVRVEDGGLKNIISVARKKELIKLAGHVRGEGDLPVRNPMGFTREEEKRLILRTSRQIKAALRKVGRK